MTLLWEKYFGLWRKYQDLGWTVLAGGDFNAAIGNELGLVNNHPSQNLAGKLLINNVEELQWQQVG